ncbi:MAG: Type 1 glutamine amidotransferase-like domain-containing protein [Pseudomonadota bacterium]
MNALDNAEKTRDTYLGFQCYELSQIGFETYEVDLRSYFGRPLELRDVLKTMDAVWVNGGNAFILRRAMQESGFDNAITNMLMKDRIAYGGFSAGVVILHNSLRGLEAIDDPHVVPGGYPKATIWQGLSLLPFSIVVHYRSDHPESDAVEEELRYYEQHGIPYKTIRDGEALVIDGEVNEIRLVGMPNTPD